MRKLWLYPEIFILFQKPDRDEWWNGQEYLLDLHVTATEHNDPHVSKRLRMSFYCKTLIPVFMLQYG